MAKTIKFNLILDGHPVRNLEGLQAHFSIEDMLMYYKNGLLLRWLDVREYRSQHDAVKIIQKTTDQEIISELIKIFELEMEESSIEKAIAIYAHQEETRWLNEEYQKNAFQKNQIILDYHSGYDALIEHMIENMENMALLKADVLILEQEYLGLFILDHVALFEKLKNYAPNAVFAVLTRNAFRPYWIGERADDKIFLSIKNDLLPIDTVKGVIGDDLKIIKRNTQAMWDPIERPEVEVMVLRIENNTFIKNAGEFSEKLGASDVNNQFLKLKGLEYQCNDEKLELLYMEV
ncbi:hypothetical protein [uncultured Acetobacterium sp.]|uniref:hypothetical protein n=1 Tax=uncultured Acetobacterium sp. TaxID=217139 RepID=UPI0025F18926|nr:hypothetical protein [uncultured Acetobacterium sp.]